MNTAKSAVIAFVNTCAGNNAWGDLCLVSRFMRGVFISRPALPRYNVTWDVGRVLQYLKLQSPPESLTLIALSRKLAMLILLLSGHRGQSLQLLDIRNITCSTSRLAIRFGDLLKQSRPGVHVDEINLPCYGADAALCVVQTYQAYRARTKSIRKQHTKLFLSTLKPHNPVHRDTLSHWVKSVLSLSGIDLSIFCPHSTRAASSSAAVTAKVPINSILRSAGWSQQSTFRRFYNRPVTYDDAFSAGILSCST